MNIIGNFVFVILIFVAIALFERWNSQKFSSTEPKWYKSGNVWGAITILISSLIWGVWGKDYLGNGYWWGRAEIASSEVDSRAIGREARVTGVVVQMERGNSKAFLNFDDKYPNQKFTGLIDIDSCPDIFKRVHFEVGQIYSISGRISEYKGIPQIVVTNENQIEWRGSVEDYEAEIGKKEYEETLNSEAAEERGRDRKFPTM